MQRTHLANERPEGFRRPGLAFLYAAPIGLLGGLIGLGGSEFRLPVLIGPLGYSARNAVPLNLAISLVTLSAALMIRATTLSLNPIGPFVPAVVWLAVGAVVAAFLGATLSRRLSDKRLERIILVLLVAIGVALIVEGFLPQEALGSLPDVPVWHATAGILFGLSIGLVSSLLGVAGGELIIPTLVFAFGADIKTAGTAGLLVSLPTVMVGLIRYATLGAFTERRALLQTVAPMSLGSAAGAVFGGTLVGLVPAAILKIGLGVILNVSAFRVLRHKDSSHDGA